MIVWDQIWEQENKEDKVALEELVALEEMAQMEALVQTLVMELDLEMVLMEALVEMLVMVLELETIMQIMEIMEQEMKKWIGQIC